MNGHDGLSGPVRALRLHRALARVWANDRGWRGVLTSVNHNDMGRRFIFASLVFFALGGVLAMLIRAQLATPDGVFVGPAQYAQLFTMHGSLMMFLFAIPLFEGLGMYLLPKMLGNREFAFPRLSALGWWCYLSGGTILVASMLAGVAPDGGWFMYVPMTSKPWSPGINADVWLLGITFVEISAVCAAIEFITTILRMRAPGMALHRMPLFAWYLLATAGMMLVGFPPLILGSILLEVERAFGWPFFDVARGGDPLLWQHLFWLFGHPEVYIIFLPAAGAISTLVPVIAGTRILGYGALVAAVLALAFLSFGLWVHHMYAVGIPHMALAFFSVASAAVAIPTSVQVFAWIGTLWSGRPTMNLTTMYVLAFLVTFAMGGLTGVMLAVVPFDWQAHDTHFVVAHLHYVLIGGFVFPMLAAAYHWLPHFTGRARVPGPGGAAFWLIVLGFHATFLPMHLTGLLGMPRRVDVYSPMAGWTALNLVSSIGGFAAAIGFALFALDVAVQTFWGPRAPRNPWRATTLEWAMATPAQSYTFASLPDVQGRDPLLDDPEIAPRLARGDGWLGRVRGAAREALGVDPVSGRPMQVIELPMNSAMPAWTALALAAFFLSMLAGAYALAPLALVAVTALALRWAWSTGARTDAGPIDVGRGTSLPLQSEAPGSLGAWGSLLAMTADGALFASLVFGWAFLWTLAPGWPPPERLDGGGLEVAVGLLAWAAGSLCARRAVRATVRGEPAAARGWLRAQLGCVAVATLATLSLAVLRLPAPDTHAYAAVSAALVGYAVVHAWIAAAMAAFVHARAGAGYLSPVRSREPSISRGWQDWAAATGATALLLVWVPEVLPWLPPPR